MVATAGVGSALVAPTTPSIRPTGLLGAAGAAGAELGEGIASPDDGPRGGSVLGSTGSASSRAWPGARCTRPPHRQDGGLAAASTPLKHADSPPDVARRPDLSGGGSLGGGAVYHPLASPPQSAVPLVHRDLVPPAIHQRRAAHRALLVGASGHVQLAGHHPALVAAARPTFPLGVVRPQLLRRHLVAVPHARNTAIPVGMAIVVVVGGHTTRVSLTRCAYAAPANKASATPGRRARPGLGPAVSRCDPCSCGGEHRRVHVVSQRTV
jgi:hypothetical protein